jgi:hypothetical protein
VRIDIVARPPPNNENHDLVEVAKGIGDQFRETLPLLDLNLIEHAEYPRGWCDLHLGRLPIALLAADAVRKHLRSH